MIRMKDPENVQGLHNFRIKLIGSHRGVEHHVEEIGGIEKVGPGIDHLVPS